MDHAGSPWPSTSPQGPGGNARKKRKLRQPRAARACTFCRRRKVRCSGTHPCTYCVNEDAEATCDFGEDGVQRSRLPGVAGASDAIDASLTPVSKSASDKYMAIDEQTLASHSTSHVTADVQRASAYTSTRPSRHNSLEPPQTFLPEGQHVGPTSGVSFLYHRWNRAYDSTATETPNDTATPVPLTSYGDSTPARSAATVPPFSLPTAERAAALLEQYFRFATPTYRFLHRPTVESWSTQLLSGARLSSARSACVLLACAQSLLYATTGDRYAAGEDLELMASKMYYDKAKDLLDHEPGPASLASVQARLANCLYLLSTFRINECRFSFSFACEILTSLGLHRKTSTAHMDLVNSESSKRTFWCAYVLDGYLSVILGRPRLFRDEDVDQSFPLNLDDVDMLSSEPLDNLPLHGNLEAFIWHAELAKLMARTNDLLYPLRSLSEAEIVVRSIEMIGAADAWRERLPGFLKPRERTLVGQRTFERQNTVLKLASAHLRILATRRCLLTDFRGLGRSNSPVAKDHRALELVRECFLAITTVVDTSYDLMHGSSMYQSFWFTQYVALVSISTLYVFLIQGTRDALPAPVESFGKIETVFEKAKHCQDALAAVAPPWSQARKHHKLLDQLKARVETKQRPKPSTTSVQDHSVGAIDGQSRGTEAPRSGQAVPHGNSLRNGADAVIDLGLASPTSAAGFLGTFQMGTFVHQEQPLQSLPDTSSNEDFTFEDWDWDSLDNLTNYPMMHGTQYEF